jgi:hypothetical protein
MRAGIMVAGTYNRGELFISWQTRIKEIKEKTRNQD